MKQFLLLLFAAFSLAMSADELNAIDFWMTTGNKVTFVLYERPLVTFQDNDLVITTPMREVRCASKDVTKFTYTSVDNSSISALKANSVSFRFEDYGIAVMNVEPLSVIDIYTTDGAHIATAKADHSGNAAVTFPSATGVTYIITTSVATFKTTKQ